MVMYFRYATFYVNDPSNFRREKSTLDRLWSWTFRYFRRKNQCFSRLPARLQS
jgi:hypothetical protein